MGGRRKVVKIVAQEVGAGPGTVNTDFGVGEAASFTAVLDVTASTGTGETLDVSFQYWDPASQKWIGLGAGAAFAQQVGVGTAGITFTAFGERLRCIQTIGGTAPTFDYTVGLFGVP